MRTKRPPMAFWLAVILWTLAVAGDVAITLIEVAGDAGAEIVAMTEVER